jgi:hypothetical protein
MQRHVEGRAERKKCRKKGRKADEVKKRSKRKETEWPKKNYRSK